MASTKRYRCIYCGKMYTREDLVRHLEMKHLDELPDTFTPMRVAYHIANKKDFTYRRKCRICGGPTSWDEEKGRYNQLCDNNNCHIKQANQMYLDMKDRRGVNSPTQTPEGLQKMLAGRKISGEYKWHDGHIYSYTGTYEKAALEFMDKVMDIKYEDLQVPGPVCKYEFEGKEHYYIPDMYYIPYNLIIEVKDSDGSWRGKNANWEEARRKQIAKEEHIIKKTNYNYIRLTGKDMSQLLAIFTQLKMELVDRTNERVVKVNEVATIEKCSKCGGKIVTVIMGEPIRRCEKCHKFIETVPFHHEETNEEYLERMLKESKERNKYSLVTERGIIKSDEQLLQECINIIDSMISPEDEARYLKEFYESEDGKEFTSNSILESGRNDAKKYNSKSIDSQIEKLYMHIIKWDYQRQKQSRSWYDTCIKSAKDINAAFSRNKNNKKDFNNPEVLQSIYTSALKDADRETGKRYDHGIPPKEIPNYFLNLDELCNIDYLNYNLATICTSYEARKYLEKQGVMDWFYTVIYNYNGPIWFS